MEESPISPHVALVAAPAMTERETKLSSEEDEVDTKEQLCERCRQELAEIMEANMLATAKLRIAELERAARKRSTDIINHARKQAAKLKRRPKIKAAKKVIKQAIMLLKKRPSN